MPKTWAIIVLLWLDFLSACVCHCQKMCKPKNLGLLALIKRSGRLSLKACDAQNLGHNRPPVVGFPIRMTGELRPWWYATW